MPRRPRFRTDALRDLLDGIRFAPPETLRRQMIAAEALAMRLEPLSLYERSSVIHAITGFRPEGAVGRAGEPAEEGGLVGQALLADLSSFIERVSERIDLRDDERPGGALTLAEAARSIGVSERSLLRYRSLGLAVHWITFSPTVRRVGCFTESLERFRARRLAERPPRRRESVSDAQRRAVLASAASLGGQRPLALGDAAALVAMRESLDPRRVRRILAHSGLDFRRQRRRARSDVRLAYRAWRRGVDPRRIAKRLERDRAATWRAVNAGRRTALRSLSLPAVEALPTFDLPMASEVLLAPDAVRGGLRTRPLPTEPAAILDEFPPAPIAPRGGEVDACRRLVAMRFLFWRASRAIAALPNAPTSHSLDRIETDLRFVAALRRTLLVHALPAAFGRLEAIRGAPLRAMAPEALAPQLRRAAAVAAASLDSADPLDAAEGRLRVARHAALVIDRELAADRAPSADARILARSPLRSVPRVELEAIAVPWSGVIPSWQRWAERAAALPRTVRTLLERRYGWNGTPPLTVMELAREARVAPSIMQRRLLDAWELVRRAR